ncbi:hypothetical protein V2J09_008841 [Rumex salicifolius]
MAASWMLSVKVASMSVGVLLSALILKLSLPVLVGFLNYELPLLWSIAVSLLRPPYLYLLINCIILTIVASSKFQPHKSEADGSAPLTPQPVQIKARESIRFAIQSPINRMFDLNDAVPPVSPVVFGYVDDLAEEKALEVRPATAEAVVGRSGDGEPPAGERVDSSETETEEFSISRSSWMPSPMRDSTDKPLLSQRFSNRKSVKASPEGGKARLGVSKSKRQDTLESTWRTITEGRPIPLTRHLKKSDTWIAQGRGGPRSDDSPSGSPAPVMKKAETFNDRTNNNNNSTLSPSPSCGGSGKLKRESPSHDELNRRVEAFIKKFNEEMRSQRQDSINQYRVMVSRGSR